MREFLVQLESRFPDLRWRPEALKRLSEKMEGELAGADVDLHKALRILADLLPSDGTLREDSPNNPFSPQSPTAAEEAVARLEAELKRTQQEAERSQLEARRLERDLAQALHRINEVAPKSSFATVAKNLMSLNNSWKGMLARDGLMVPRADSRPCTKL